VHRPLPLPFDLEPPLTPCSRSPPRREPNPDPNLQWLHSSTPRRQRRRPGHRGRPSWAGQHRPPQDLSPRRRAPLHVLDQFPKTEGPEPDRARHCNPAEPSYAARPERLERAARSHVPRPRLASQCMHADTASSPSHDATLALHCNAPTRPRHAPFCRPRHWN
jgi:hypothetical protein